jgi:hypothetical protein
VCTKILIYLFFNSKLCKLIALSIRAIDILEVNGEKQTARLNIAFDAPDHGKPYRQWFHFRAIQIKSNTLCNFTIENASQTTYPGGWVNYNVAYSYDRETWRRCKTAYDENGTGHMSWSFPISIKSILAVIYA